jgi:ferredoxin-type protein NapH
MSTFTFPRKPFKYPLHTFRGLVVQPFFWALMFISPLVQIYQMDVINQRLIFMGKSYPLDPSTLFWLPIGFFGCCLIIAVVSTMWGRLFCGWVCPHNSLTEWTRPIRTFIGIGHKPFHITQLEARWPWLKVAGILYSLVWALVLTYLISTLFLFYFVPVPWFFQQLQAGTLPFIIWSGQGMMMLIGVFMVYAGHEFCKSACPYGLMQSLSAYLTAKWTPMEVRYKPGDDTSECKSCSACRTVCPVDIDPRKVENLVVGIGEGCFNCGECLDACSYVRGAQDKENLLRFSSPFNASDNRIVAPRDIAH